MYMSELLTLPEGMTTGNPEKLHQKLTRFMGRAAEIHVVADFDRTLTDRRPGSNEDITSWNILRDHLPRQGQQYCEALFQAARPKELAGTMTEQDAVDWWSAVLDTYAEYRIDMNDVERDFLHRATIREGSREFFTLCRGAGIPIAILSAGVKDVIDLWSDHYDVQPTLTISTKLVLDEARKITGWQKDTLVHVLNKSEVDHPELHKIRSERPLAIVFGDGIGDADMALGDEDVLRARVYDPRPDEIVDIETERARTFERFDLMIESGTLAPLVRLLKELAK